MITLYTQTPLLSLEPVLNHAAMFVRLAVVVALSVKLCQASVGGPVPSAENPDVDIIYQFPQTMAPENEFLRSNGQLLTTCLTCNVLSQLDPTLGPTQKRRTVYTFGDGVANVLGIDQLFEDVFAVAVGQVDFSNPLQPVSYTHLTLPTKRIV